MSRYLLILLVCVMASSAARAAEIGPIVWEPSATDPDKDAGRVSFLFPANWEKREIDVPLNTTRGFYKHPASLDETMVGLIVTSVASPRAGGEDFDLGTAGDEELDMLSDGMVRGVALGVSDARDVMKHDYRLVIIDGVRGLSVTLSYEFDRPDDPLFNFQELVGVPYKKRTGRYRGGQSAVALHCTFNGLARNDLDVIQTFADNYESICAKFFLSVKILDK
ncbi:MAG: hypothetical protein LBP95_03640 [Deltaproteobacteria bacterium]|jgi:hypothetical protein|nr:hypothetical protein [Deltaproteobacteria bacterium]